MTTNPEAGGYVDTDSLLRERMLPHLATEAIENFFERLSELPLSKRAKMIARQAKILELYSSYEQTTQVPEYSKPADIHALPSLELPSTDVADMPAEEHVITNDVSEVGSSEAAVINQTIGHELEADELNYEMSRFLDHITGETGIAQRLGIKNSQADKGIVVGVILDNSKPFKGRSNPDELRMLLELKYDGTKNADIGEALGTTRKGIELRLLRIRERAEKNNTNFAAILERQFKLFRDEEMAVDIPGAMNAGGDRETEATHDVHLEERVQKYIVDIFGEEAQPLATEENKAALRGALYDMIFQGRNVRQSAIDKFAVRMPAFIDGLTDTEVAKLDAKAGNAGNNRVVSVWLSQTKGALKKKYTSQQALELLKSKISSNSTQISEISDLQNGELNFADETIEQQQMTEVSDEDLNLAAIALQRVFEGDSAEQTAETEEVDPRTKIDESLSRFVSEKIIDEQTAESLKKLLYEEKVDAEMAPGREWLAELVSKYMPNSTHAKDLMGEELFDKDVLATLHRLSQFKGRQQGVLEQSLPTLLKYSRIVTEQDVLEYLSVLFDTTEADPHFADSTLKARVANISDFRRLHRPIEQAQGTPEVSNKSVNLWDVARGKAEANAGMWQAAVEKMFEDAVANKQFTRTEAVSLKPRVLGESNDRKIDDDVRSALHKLQQLAMEPGINLEQDPEAAQVFKMFTVTVFGANSIKDIVKKLNSKRPHSIAERRVKNKLVGGIAYVLEGGNK